MPQFAEAAPLIRFLLDADIAIYATTTQVSALRDHLVECEPGSVGISPISYAEPELGMALGKPPTPEALAAHRSRPHPFLRRGAACAYAALPFKRARFDRLLAAHALSLGAIVVTNNEADFADVPGLRLERTGWFEACSN